MKSLQEICLLGKVTEMGQVYTVELANLPDESLKPRTYFDRLVTKSELSLEEKSWFSPREYKSAKKKKLNPVYKIFITPITVNLLGLMCTLAL